MPSLALCSPPRESPVSRTASLLSPFSAHGRGRCFEFSQDLNLPWTASALQPVNQHIWGHMAPYHQAVNKWVLRSPSVGGWRLGAVCMQRLYSGYTGKLSHSHRLAAKFTPFLYLHISCLGRCAKNPGPNPHCKPTPGKLLRMLTSLLRFRGHSPSAHRPSAAEEHLCYRVYKWLRLNCSWHKNRKYYSLGDFS